MAEQYIKVPQHLQPSDPQGYDILAAERAKATFPTKELSLYLFGKAHIDRLNRLLPVLENDRVLDKSNVYYMGRNERYRYNLARSKRVAQLKQKYGWSVEDLFMVDWLLDSPYPFGVHNSMYLTTLRNQTNEEQKLRLLGPAERYEHIGCYAQTELGHGSNIQGIETEARYMKEKQEFELHSPFLTSAKWWIGSCGRTANHAVVMAQLIVDGKRLGVHPFHVQLRDLKSFEPINGITVGDIGPKLGYVGMDNGMILFDRVRIPHRDMLARFARVNPVTGKYTKPEAEKIAYGTMTWVRTNNVQEARMVAAKAVTIAIRYCAIRRQFQNKDQPERDGNDRQIEVHVIDYTTVQNRLFIVLASVFAMHFMGMQMRAQYEENQRQINSGSFDLLADLHATSSGLKSLCTTMASDSIEICRRSCGGHGFSAFSGLTSAYVNYISRCSTEGDNFMITQQVGRYIIKSIKGLSQTNFSRTKNATEEYLKDFKLNPNRLWNVQSEQNLKDRKTVLEALAYRAGHLAFSLYEKREVQNRSWNSLLVDVYNVSVAHSQYFMIRAFYQAFEKNELNGEPSLKKLLEDFFLLHSLHVLETSAATDLLASGHMTGKQHALVSKLKHHMFEVVRPNAVATVDAFLIPDYQLNSALGKYDGRVYEDLFKRASQEPLVTFNSDYRSAELGKGEPPYEPLLKEMRLDKANLSSVKTLKHATQDKWDNLYQMWLK